MSAQTKAALDQAMRDHFADEAGEGFVATEWIALAAGVRPKSESMDRTICWEDSDLAQHHHIGLARHHLIRMEAGVIDD